MTEPETVRHWKQEWDTFHQEVRTYFQNRPQDLLEFNITTEGHSPEKIIRFFRPHLQLSARHWHFKGKTDDILYQKAVDREKDLLQQAEVTEATDLLSQLREVCLRAGALADNTQNQSVVLNSQHVGQLQMVMDHLESQLQNLTG